MFEDSSHRRALRIGILLAILGMAASFLTITVVPHLLAVPATPLSDTSQRLAYALRWLTLPGLTLLAGVIAAARRGFYADAIDGTRTPTNHALEINLRYNQNTIEQVLLAAIAWLAAVVELPVATLTMIPVVAALFVVGRITFWVGYLIHSMGRAFGMTVTVVPTLAMYGWLAHQALA